MRGRQIFYVIISIIQMFSATQCARGLTYQETYQEVTYQELAYEELAYEDCPQGKVVALTFDDGPGPYTDALLDILSERGAKATFFLIGNRVTPETAPLVARMTNEGHSVGSHTFSHTRLTLLSNRDIQLELEKTDNAIKNVVGITPYLVRPPFGSYDDRVVMAINRPVILWSLDTIDWKLNDAETVKENITKHVKDGDVILLHELKQSSLDGVAAAMDTLLKEGYTFVTVPELFSQRGIELTAGMHYHDACDIGH